jgi:glycosyltransferase involved in cell wall biosynthesis
MTRPIRVLSVIGELLMGGGENRLLSLARSIDRQRFEHTVLTLNRADLECAERAVMPRQYADAGIAVHELETAAATKSRRRLAVKGFSLARRVRRLSRLIKELQIDVIDAHMETAALTATAAGVLTNRPVCVTLYHADPLVRPALWGLARQFMLANTALVITDSAVRGNEICDAALRRRPPAAIVPNGVWMPHPVRSREEMRKMLGIPTDPQTRVIGQVSAFLEFKGQLVLLDAARDVLREQPHAYFLLVGYTSHDESFRGRVERKAAELGIADRVRILTYPGPIGDVWQLIDIHVHASLFDSLPNAIIEGMALAKPAVVTAVGGVPAAVINEKTGLVVKPGDSRALANGLLKLLRHPAYAAQLGQAAFAEYQRGYRPDVTARKLESCFESVLHPRSWSTLNQWKHLKDAR